jgi:Tol biopolymer transport system component
VVLCLVVVACGRIGFSTLEQRDAAVDAGSCTWSPPVRIPGSANTMLADEWGGTPTVGSTQLFFHSYRAPDSDVYVATRDNPLAAWSAASRVLPLDSGVDQWMPTLTEDGLIIVYSDEASGQYKLWMATRNDPTGAFGSGAPLPVVNAGPAAQDNHPWISADGLRLLFMSTRMGTDRIFETTRPERTAVFAPPTVLALGSGDASNPTLSADGRELFFISKRGGGADVWTAHRPAIDQPFDTPVKVDALSSSRDECCLRLSLDGTTLYLDYDTLTAGGGSADIYTATRSCN